MNVNKHDKQKLIDMLSMMVKIRTLELQINDLFSKGLIYGTTHLYAGQEAVAVGSCYSLKKNDLVASTHRGHGHAIARGVDLRKLTAEILGRKEGTCRGRGGTQHLCNLDKGFLGTNGITGGFIPIAVGAAFALKKKKTGGVVLSFFGDGASNTGYFHESLNFASIKKLPVIFICENNLYAMSTHVKDSTSVDNIADRAPSYSMPGVIVDGMDPLKVEESVIVALERARKGGGPTLIEAKTYRYLGHSKSDRRVYRTPEEEEVWRARDPIDNLAKALKKSGKASSSEVEETISKAEDEVRQVVQWALSLPLPQADEVKGEDYDA